MNPAERARTTGLLIANTPKNKMPVNEARNMDWEAFDEKLCEYELIANISEIEAKDRVRAIASIYKISWQQAIEKLLTENRTSPWRTI